MKSICESIGCMYWRNGKSATGESLGSYGCKRFPSARSCPVSLLQFTTATEYEVHCNTDYNFLDAAVKALCPDPRVRLEALAAEWPVESLRRIESRDLLADTDYASEVKRLKSELWSEIEE